MSRETMTVAELIELLRRMPPDAEVRTEGCDCIGDAASVDLSSDGVMICREGTVGAITRNGRPLQPGDPLSRRRRAR